jgi:anti-sigma-K factor RskA
MVALAAAAAAVVLIIALIPRETPDWELDIVAGPSTGAWGDILGFNEPTETRLVLNIYDLPPAETGTFYEVWWVRDSGEAVSSGSFLGSDTIDMWMGIRRSEFPEMLITIEPSDGNPAPSDTIVARSAP